MLRRMLRYIPLLLISMTLGVILPKQVIPQLSGILLLVIQMVLAGSFLAVLLFVIMPPSKEIAQLQALKDRNYIKDVVIKMNHAVIEVEDSQELYQRILDTAIESLPSASAGSLMMMGEDGVLHFVASAGFPFEELAQIAMPLEDTFLYINNRGNYRKPAFINNKRAFDEKYQERRIREGLDSCGVYEWNSSLSVPILLDEELFGVLSVDGREYSAFGREDLLIMEYFSSQTAIVLKNHQYLEKTIYLSKHDPLSNLYNRRYFKDLVIHSIHRCERGDSPFQLVLMDLDNFKIVNDSYGHICGDHVIIQFASVLITSLRAADIIARYGGDEFVGIFFHCSAEEIENRITAIKKETMGGSIQLLDGTRFPIDFSYGISSWSPGMSYDDLLRDADKRMYLNKEKGKLL